MKLFIKYKNCVYFRFKNNEIKKKLNNIELDRFVKFRNPSHLAPI